MAYREILPHRALRPWVDRFWVREPEARAPATSELDCILPDGCVDVLIALDVRSVDVVGTMTQALHVHASRASIAAARFRPGAAAALLGVAAHALTDRRVPLAALGRSWLSPRAVGAASPRQALRWLEASLLARIEGLSFDAAVARAVELSFGQSPPPVTELARKLGWSRQRLTRVLLDEVGIGAKQLLRVGRLQRAVAELQRSPSVGLAQAAAGLGYFDQAHLCRDFRELVGLSPSVVRASPHTIFPIRSLLAGA